MLLTTKFAFILSLYAIINCILVAVAVKSWNDIPLAEGVNPKGNVPPKLPT